MSDQEDSYRDHNNKRKDYEGDSGNLTKFKIPKKEEEDDNISNYSNAQFIYNSGNSIASNSYYEYYNRYTQLQWQNSTAYPPQYYGRNFGSSPSAVEPITQNICNTLSSIKETPKNCPKDIFREIAPDTNDPTLPKELKKQFQPLYCKLCSAHLSSNVMAKLHYKSKNHEKKVRKWLVDYAESTGTPVHKRAQMCPTAKPEKETDPKWYHCVDCDLVLTGKMHAESHYMGKNHQKVVMGYKLPTGPGHYNNEGKWVRESLGKKTVLQDGDDGFGRDFREKKVEPTAATEPTTPQQPATIPSKFHCSICNIGTTCQEQLDIHFQGQKHRKKLRQLGVADEHMIKGDFAEVPVDLYLYRTPSGDYYCPSCNITINSGVQFKVHIKGKTHFKKTAQQKSQ